MKNYFFGWFLACCFWLPVFSQQPEASTEKMLSLTQVVQQIIARNPQIKIIQNQREQAANQVDIGNAGMLPNVNASAGINYSNTNTFITLADNSEIEGRGAESLERNAGVFLDYTLFDGLAMFKNYQLFQNAFRQADAQTQLQTESILMQGIQAYFQVLQAQLNVDIGRNTVAISQERFLRAKTAAEFGQNNAVQLLSAEVDLSSDSVNLMQAELALNNAKRQLGLIMYDSAAHTYTVEENLPQQASLDYTAIEADAFASNANLKNVQLRIEAAQLSKSIASAQRLPTLSLNAGYRYSLQENEVGFLLENQNNGLNAGLSLNYPIFTGNQRSIAIQNAKIRHENEQLAYNQAHLEVKMALQTAFANYQQALRALRLTERTVQSAELNFKRSKDLFDLGQLTNTQFREAQLNLQATELQRVQAAIQVAINEYELYGLSGNLVEKF